MFEIRKSDGVYLMIANRKVRSSSLLVMFSFFLFLMIKFKLIRMLCTRESLWQREWERMVMSPLQEAIFTISNTDCGSV